MLTTWRSIVYALIPRRRAICAFDSPAASRRKTSISLRLSVPTGTPCRPEAGKASALEVDTSLGTTPSQKKSRSSLIIPSVPSRSKFGWEPSRTTRWPRGRSIASERETSIETWLAPRRATGEPCRGAVARQMARASLQAASAVDVTDILPSVRAETLVLHRRGASQVSMEVSRSLAMDLPRGHLVVLEGSQPNLLLEGTE